MRKGITVFRRHSSHNEGKIHLGYVYANDRSLRTARTMVRGGIVFQRLLRRWLGHAIDAVPVSAPFYYVVHRQSLLDVTEIDAHLRAVHRIVMEESGEGPLDYFGSDYREPPQRLSDAECRALFNERWIAAAYLTAEIGIDSEALAVPFVPDSLLTATFVAALGQAYWLCGWQMARS